MFHASAIFVGDRWGSWVYLHRFTKKFVKVNFSFNAIKVSDKLRFTIVHRQVAIQQIFMRLVFKINLSLVLHVMIHKIINLLSGTYLIFNYTKYSYSSSLNVWMRAQPKRVIEKKNPLVENVFLTIGIEWAYLRQNRRDDRHRFWTFPCGITQVAKKGLGLVCFTRCQNSVYQAHSISANNRTNLHKRGARE